MKRTCCSSMARRAPMQEAGHSSARAFLLPAAAAMRPLTSFQTACPVGNGPCWLDASSNKARVMTALHSGNETSPLIQVMRRHGQTLCDTNLTKQRCCTYEPSYMLQGTRFTDCSADLTDCPLANIDLQFTQCKYMLVLTSLCMCHECS